MNRRLNQVKRNTSVYFGVNQVSKEQLKMAKNIVVSALLMNDSSASEDGSEEEDSTNITAIALSLYVFFFNFK